MEDTNQGLSEFLGKIFDLFTFRAQTITTIGVIVIMLIFFLVIRAKFLKYDPKKVNSKFQIIVEMMYDYFYDITLSMLGKEYARRFTPIATIMFLSVFLGNIAGVLIIPTESAMINPFFTFTWSISMFIIWTGYGIYKSGLGGWVKNGLVGEVWVLAPIETLGYLTKPISLGARMLGNISAGGVIVLIFWAIPNILANAISGAGLSILTGSVTAVIFGVIGSGLLGFFSLFGPFIQATVFTYLTLSYFAGLIPQEEE